MTEGAGRTGAAETVSGVRRQVVVDLSDYETEQERAAALARARAGLSLGDVLTIIGTEQEQVPEQVPQAE